MLLNHLLALFSHFREQLVIDSRLCRGLDLAVIVVDNVLPLTFLIFLDTHVTVKLVAFELSLLDLAAVKS